MKILISDDCRSAGFRLSRNIQSPSTRIWYKRVLSILIISWLILSGLGITLLSSNNSIVSAATINSSGTKPTNGEIITGKYTFEVNDAGSATSCELRIDGLLIATMDSTGVGNPDWNYTLDTSGFTDGSHLIRYDSIGGTGGTDIVTIPVKFDNNGPTISNATTLYPKGQEYAKPGDLITVVARVVEPVSSILSVTCDTTMIGGSAAETMYDDGLHNDGAPNDKVYGTASLSVNTTGGYWACYVHATDSQNNLRNVTAAINVDIYEPTILDIQTVLPAGQNAVKNGDQIRVTAKALDYKIIISDKVTRKPLDVVLVLDNSGSMSGTSWANLETAATTFIDKLAESDRCAIVSFDAQGDPEGVKQYSTFLTMSETYNDPQGSSYTSTGRNVSKYIVTQDDGLHLTKWTWGGYQPNCWTPIWDAIGRGIQYAINSRRTDAVPVVIAITDGDDWGTGRGREHGSETYCPGAPNGATGQTWAVSGGCIWNSPDRAYSSVQREIDAIPLNALTTVSFFSGSAESTRTGLINATIPVFTIGLGIVPQGTNSSAGNYLPPTANSYKYTTEFDLVSIANSSVGGRYYYAPNSNQLTQIYKNVSQVIQKYGVETLGLKQPNGISSVQADFSAIGISLKVNMFDDGNHGDAKAGDDIYGSDVISVNSLNSGKIVFHVEGTDKAGNVNNTQFIINLDNTQPLVSRVNTTYPANRTKAQDGYSIYVVANCSDAETGLGKVYLDASKIGGATQVPMVDDGSGNDYRAFDGLYTSKNVTLATGLVSGVYTYTVNAYDKAGNVGSQSGNIDIYNDVDITMKNLQDGDVVSGNFQIIANITDPDGIPASATNPRYRVDLNPWYKMSLLSGTDYAAVMNTSQYLDGSHTLYVYAKDSYGAESTIETNFKIDNTPPSQVNVITPIPNEFIEGVYSFKVNAKDAIGIRNVTLSILNESGYKKVNNATLGYNSGTGYYEYVLGTTALSDGKYNLTVIARDYAGFETTSKNLTFNIDNHDPKLTLNYPKNGNFVWGIVKMNITFDETFLDTIEYNVDNSGWVNYLVPWNTTLIDDGSHTVQIKIKDLAGHEVLVTIHVTVDNNFPVCVLSQPGKERFIEGTYVFRSYSFDEVGIKSVRLRINHVVDINATNKSITEVLNTTMGYNSGTGYYEYVFDTSGQPDGNYTINVTAKDTAGNATHTGDITFYIDNNPPEVMLINPYEGKIVSGNVVFDIFIINETFLDWMRYNIDGAGWVDATTPWDTTLVNDGAHTVKIRIHDLAGHNTDLTIKVFVDNKNPLCSIVSPVANQYIEGLYTFKVAASDLVEIENVTLFVFGEMVNTTYNTQTSSYEYTVDTSVYNDGSYFLTAIAYDTSGKSKYSNPIPFHVDNHAPILTLNSPTEGQYVFGTIVFDVTVTELFGDKVEYNIDGKGWVPIYTPWNTTGLKDGKHIVQVRATDKFGHITEQTINLIVDNHNPTCIIHAPIENQYLEDTFTFRIVAFDVVGIDYVELVVFYKTVNAPFNSNTGYYEYTIDTSNFEDGRYNVTAVCRDLANRTTITEPLDFKVDNEYPILQVKAPLNGVFVEGDVKIDLEISDAFPCITQYNIDGNGWIPYQVNPVWNSTTVLDGEHELEIRSIDPSGHTSEHKLIIYVDNHAPTCALHSPAEDEFIEGTFTFKVLALDALGIDHVLIKMFGATVNATYNSQTNYFEYSKSLARTFDGTYNVTIIAVDKSGKSTTVGPLQFNVDANAPVVTLYNPVSNTFVSGNTIIELKVEDAFETVTSYNVDGSGWVGTQIPWNTKLSGDGEHTIQIRALDAAGHSVVQQITVKVDNTPPKVSVVLPKEGDYISGIYTVKIYAADTFGIESVILYLDSGLPLEISQNPSTGLYELPLDTTKLMLEDGEHLLTVEAVDKRFHISNETLKIYIDNSPPEMQLIYPKKGKGQIEFEVNATDLSGIDMVLINIDGTGWIELSSYVGKNDSYRHIWRTGKGDNGYHLFDVKAIDVLGNEVTVPGDIRVDNKEETDYLGYLLRLLPLIVFIVIIIIIIIVFMLFRRGTFSKWLKKSTGKGREGEEDDELGEMLNEDEDYDFEFSRSAHDEQAVDTEYYSDDENYDYGRSASRKGKSNDIDWFQEEKPPNILKGSKKRTAKRGVKPVKSKKTQSETHSKSPRPRMTKTKVRPKPKARKTKVDKF